MVSKNRREENLRHFRERFLGTDYWGKHAYFENDSVLIFHPINVTESERYDHESFLLPADSSSTLFTVSTKGPLLVNKPLLGYKLHINLIHYTEVQTGNDKDYRFHTLGYFYFQPEEDASKRKTNRFRKKQLEAWYNSDRHFCRSLFNDQLKENGFIVTKSGFGKFNDDFKTHHSRKDYTPCERVHAGPGILFAKISAHRAGFASQKTGSTAYAILESLCNVGKW